MLSENRKQLLTIFAAIGCGCAVLMVPVLGVVSAIAIPNFLDALQKAKQKRTMADMRTTGTAVMSWLVDRQDTTLPPGWTEGQILSPDELAAQLVPEYVGSVPPVDGWGFDFVIEVVGDDISTRGFLRISSPGRDGFFNPQQVEGAFDSIEYDSDIVWQDGFFLSYPAGLAQSSP